MPMRCYVCGAIASPERHVHTCPDCGRAFCPDHIKTHPCRGPDEPVEEYIARVCTMAPMPPPPLTPRTGEDYVEYRMRCANHRSDVHRCKKTTRVKLDEPADTCRIAPSGGVPGQKPGGHVLPTLNDIGIQQRRRCLSKHPETSVRILTAFTISTPVYVTLMRVGSGHTQQARSRFRYLVSEGMISTEYADRLYAVITPAGRAEIERLKKLEVNGR